MLAVQCVKFCREFLENLLKVIAIISSEKFLKKDSECDPTQPSCFVLHIEGLRYTKLEETSFNS